jgi:hypothetical protein
MLNRWITMIEKQLGTGEFRAVAGMEERPPFRAVVFVGGVTPSQDFEGEWLRKWSDIGGSGAGGLTQFDPAIVKGYLKAFPGGRYKYLVPLGSNWTDLE